MEKAFEQEQVIDVVVRLPRSLVENHLLSASSLDRELGAVRLGEAKALITGRRRRATCFNGVRFGDPSWDMILELYVATREGRHLTVSQLSSLSGGSNTTALRHIEHLEALGFINRSVDPDDRRRANVGMDPVLLEATERWLDLQLTASKLGR